ncbi:MAG: hypothetical protein ABI972_08730 [Acidobacteriota bacterium]
MTSDPNREMVIRMARQLGPLCDEFVLVGGSAAGLLVTEVAGAPVRVTRDVDMVVEVGSYASYSRLSERLRAQGFSEDTSEDAPLCRWRHKDLILDVMPVEEKVLGFGNRWYRAAVEQSQAVELARGLEIGMITAPYFLGTKFEAFASRGKGDYWASQDLEDIVVVVDGRAELPEEVAASENTLRTYTARWMTRLLAENDFQAALPGYLMPDEGSQARLGLVLERMRTIAAGARVRGA